MNLHNNEASYYDTILWFFSPAAVVIQACIPRAASPGLPRALGRDTGHESVHVRGVCKMLLFLSCVYVQKSAGVATLAGYSPPVSSHSACSWRALLSTHHMLKLEIDVSERGGRWSRTMCEDFKYSSPENVPRFCITIWLPPVCGTASCNQLPYVSECCTPRWVRCNRRVVAAPETCAATPNVPRRVAARALQLVHRARHARLQQD